MEDSTLSCGVCCDDLTQYDNDYPILCPTANCDFNMCIRCISHFIDSSKQDFEMASDGNMHVKVKLQCPSCRGDFSTTIQDTLLIRTAMDMYQKYKDKPDTELSSSELRLKYKYTLSLIEEIQGRLLLKTQPIRQGTTVTTTHHNPNESSTTAIRKISSSSLQDGTNTTLLLPPLFFPNTKILIDTALFSGLNSVMSFEEQLFVTQLMISGNTNQLAQAAQILYGIANVVRQGYRLHPNKVDEGNPTQGKGTSSSSPTTRLLVVNPSVAITEPTIILRHSIEDPSSSSSSSSITFMGTQAEHVELDNKIQKHFALHPLPTFMPLFISMDANFNMYAKHRKLIKLMDDDGWDGTVADGFARVMLSSTPKDDYHHSSIDEEDDDDEEEEETDETIELSHKEEGVEVVTKDDDFIKGENENENQSTENDQENNIGTEEKLSSSPTKISIQSTTTSSSPIKAISRTMKRVPQHPRQCRVLIRQARGKAASMGISPGMVVSHFNGEEFHGTAEELKQRIHQLYLSSDRGYKNFTLVLNADIYTAELLKLRSNFRE